MFINKMAYGIYCLNREEDLGLLFPFLFAKFIIMIFTEVVVYLIILMLLFIGYDFINIVASNDKYFFGLCFIFGFFYPISKTEFENKYSENDTQYNKKAQITFWCYFFLSIVLFVFLGWLTSTLHLHKL